MIPGSHQSEKVEDQVREIEKGLASEASNRLAAEGKVEEMERSLASVTRECEVTATLVLSSVALRTSVCTRYPPSLSCVVSPKCKSKCRHSTNLRFD